METYVWSLERGYRKLKESAMLSEYQTRYPSAIKVRKAPAIATIERWSYDGIAKAVDGCKVEPDGTCPHERPSWLIVLGMI